MKRAIEASIEVRADLARVREILVNDPGAVLARTCSPEQRRTRRFRTELSVDIGTGASVRQEVTIEAGEPDVDLDNGTVALPLAWHATRHERLFPSFRGTIEARAAERGTTVLLLGAYTVPLGPLGRFGDGVAGRRLAHRSLETFLETVQHRLDAELRRRQPPALNPGASTVSIRELPSEVYIG